MKFDEAGQVQTDLPGIWTIILAAGEGSRYGGVKQLHWVGGQTMIEKVIAIHTAINPAKVIVVVGAHFEEVDPVLKNLPVNVVLNPGWREGIASSIRCGVEWIMHRDLKATGILLVLADQPHIDNRHFEALLASHASHPDAIIASRYNGSDGVPALFPTKYWLALLELSGDRGAKALINAHQAVKSVILTEGGDDIDTP